jgi:hypothetical protein
LRPGAIGDFIVSLPALEHLRADYTEVWTTAANVPLARFADRARSLQSTGIGLLGLPGIEPPPALMETLAGFDSIVSWYGANRAEFRAAMRPFPVTFHDALPPAGAIHATDFYLRQVGAPPGAAPRLPVGVARQDYAVIHPFSGSPHKNWPIERFREVAAALPLEVKWTAGPDEALDEAVRFDNLWDLAEWIGGARLYIGNDSGITHLAAAAGTPAIAVFGPTDPAVWAPRGAVVLVNPDEAAVCAAAIAQIGGSTAHR